MVLFLFSVKYLFKTLFIYIAVIKNNLYLYKNYKNFFPATSSLTTTLLRLHYGYKNVLHSIKYKTYIYIFKLN